MEGPQRFGRKSVSATPTSCCYDWGIQFRRRTLQGCKMSDRKYCKTAGWDCIWGPSNCKDKKQPNWITRVPTLWLLMLPPVRKTCSEDINAAYKALSKSLVIFKSKWLWLSSQDWSQYWDNSLGPHCHLCPGVRGGDIKTIPHAPICQILPQRIFFLPKREVEACWALAFPG